MLVLRSSSSSMGEEEERRELSDGLKEGELLSPCSTDRELGLSSRAWTKSRGGKQNTDCSNAESLDCVNWFKLYASSFYPFVTKFVSPHLLNMRPNKWSWFRLLSYHFAFDQLLDGAHQLSSTGCLRTGWTDWQTRRGLHGNEEVRGGRKNKHKNLIIY